MNSETRQVLAQARDLLARGWTRSAYARDKHQYPTGIFAEDAVCFCTMGALTRAAKCSGSQLRPFLKALMFHDDGEVMVWNDWHDRTQQQVLDRFNFALEGGEQG